MLRKFFPLPRLCVLCALLFKFSFPPAAYILNSSLVAAPPRWVFCGKIDLVAPPARLCFRAESPTAQSTGLQPCVSIRERHGLKGRPRLRLFATALRNFFKKSLTTQVCVPTATPLIKSTKIKAFGTAPSSLLWLTYGYEREQRNSGGNSVGAQTETTGSNPDEVNAALRQLRATVSGFVQEAQASTEKTESLIAHVDQMGRQLRATDSKAQQSAAQIEKLSSWIASNRP